MTFWSDVRDLREAIDTKVKEGRGSKALSEAVAELPSKSTTTIKRKSHKKTFIISAIFGMIWQSMRRR